MPRSSHRGVRPSQRLLQRIEQAAAEFNPYLLLPAFGLAIVNLTCLALLASEFAANRNPVSGWSCPVGAGAAPAATPETSGGQPRSG